MGRLTLCLCFALVFVMMATYASNAEELTAPPMPEQQNLDSAKTLSQLFTRLAHERDPEKAQAIARLIEAAFDTSPSATAGLMLQRIRFCLANEDAPHGRMFTAPNPEALDTAQELANKLVAFAPDWPSAWFTRASLRAVAGDEDGAMVDLAKTLSLEPRHFSALALTGQILLKNNETKSAFQVYQKLLALYPAMVGVKSLAEQLAIKVLGAPI